MRAGLLSDPRVVVALRTLFIPVHMSALNTACCMHDARDEALLAKYAGDATDRFQGGEREVFILPDGTMQRVFMSLSGNDLGEATGRASHYTAAGRRDDSATRMFRHHGAAALSAVHRDPPTAWRELWDVEGAAALQLRDEAPRWPEPAAGKQGLRVFVRNSHPRYDDLHGAQVVVVADDVANRWAGGLVARGDRTELPRPAFETLANAMVPRGTIDPELSASSIGGKLELVAESLDGDLVKGRIEGDFALRPVLQTEVGKRPNAAISFEVAGRFTGRFQWNRAAKTFTVLRVVVTDARLAWQSVTTTDDDFAPRYRAAIEWVRGAPPAR